MIGPDYPVKELVNVPFLVPYPDFTAEIEAL